MASWESLLAVSRPWVVAHRGYSARYPENTLAAIEGAIQARADAVEINVALTADRVPIVMHDDRVDRTTNGSGLVAYMTADAVTSLDAGSWFAPHFADERVPTLESVLERIDDRILLSLELRSSAYEDDDREDALELLVINQVQRHGLAHSVALATFEPRYFARIERQNQSIPRMLFCDRDLCELDAVAVCERLGIMAFRPEAERIDQSDVLRLRAAGLQVVPWTVNDEGDMRRLLDWGVDGLVTDEVERLQSLIVSEYVPADG